MPSLKLAGGGSVSYFQAWPRSVSPALQRKTPTGCQNGTGPRRPNLPGCTALYTALTKWVITVFLQFSCFKSHAPSVHGISSSDRTYYWAPAKRSHHANATYRNIDGCNMLRAFGHCVAMCCDTLGVVGSRLKMVKFDPTTPNMSQHVATRWQNARNMLRPKMLWYVALTCCDRLAGALLACSRLSVAGDERKKGELEKK